MLLKFLMKLAYRREVRYVLTVKVKSQDFLSCRLYKIFFSRYDTAFLLLSLYCRSALFFY